ncbi:MAG: MFS transporter [Candidatus Levybacteria bacterium]|nr:MFS transporter [Candidatus Levybacteria bacterium]
MDKKLFTILLVAFIDLLGFGILIPILPLLIEKTGGGAFLVGAVIAIFSLFQFIFSPVLGRLSDKYGRKPILILSSFINSISYLMLFSSQSLPIIIFARIIAGIGSANLSVAQAYIADTSASHERTKRMALLGAVFGLGFIFGPLVGGVASGISAGFPFLITAVLSIVNTVLIYIILPESNKTLKKHIKIQLINWKVTREVIRPKNMFFLMFLFFFVNLSLALIIGVFPLYSQMKFGWNEAQNGYYFGLIGIGSFVTQVFLIRLLLKKFSESQIIRLALIVFAISVTAIGLIPVGVFALFIGPFISFGISLVNVNVQSLISLESDVSEQGIVLGVSQSFGSLARIIGPLVGGAIASFNLSAPYIVSGIFTLFIFIFGQNYLRYIKARRK